MAQQPKRNKIIWAETKEQFLGLKSSSREALPAICSTIRFFDPETAEASDEVFIIRGHAKTEACAAHYKKLGAKVTLFGEEPEPKAKPEPRAKKEPKPEPKSEELGS